MQTHLIDPDALPGRACSAAAALDLVGDRWTMLVVREVLFGNHRFSEIVRGTGAPRDRLADRLARLVDAGILERRPYSEHPPRSDYHLTASGRGLVPVLEALRQWGDRWAVQEVPVRAVHGADGDRHEVVGEWRCRTCGERTGAGGFALVRTGAAEHAHDAVHEVRPEPGTGA
ncbi:winged helix-turn-helix transcriptional regulator [Rhodococcus aerolatus]